EGIPEGVSCPTCGRLAQTSAWQDMTQEITLLENEEFVRNRVLSILNCDRASFDTTPLYNNFLEKREEIIYDLVYSDDKELISDRNNYLTQYEQTSQTQTLEAEERRRKREVEE